MSIGYGCSDPLKGVASDGLIFYLHPVLSTRSGGFVDLVDGQFCTANGGVTVHDETFDFDGTTGWIDTNRVYIDDGTYTLSSSTDKYTLEAWVKVRSSQGGTTDADSIIGSQGSVGVGMQMGINTGLPRVNFGARSTSNFYGSNLAYNTWYHIVWAHDHGVTTTVYVNGVVDITSVATSYAINAGTWGNMTIGNSSARVTGFLDGQLGPIRIYNRGLTQAEVTQNFNATRARYGI